jgi:hypothetical protein
MSTQGQTELATTNDAPVTRADFERLEKKVDAVLGVLSEFQNMGQSLNEMFTDPEKLQGMVMGFLGGGGF